MSLVNRRAVTIEWGDCDAAGIVFYPRYFAIFDACTGALFKAALGMTKRKWTARFGILGIPMVDTRGRFAIPSTHGDEVVVESRIAAFRRSSFDVEHRLLRPDGALGVEGFETRVWTVRDPVDPTDPKDPGRIRSAPIPPEVIAAFGHAYAT